MAQMFADKDKKKRYFKFFLICADLRHLRTIAWQMKNGNARSTQRR
jgi:hypothetical protein